MTLRSMGAGGARVFPIGIGAMSFADFYGATTDENSYAILQAALEASVNHIDTSNVYGIGRSETVIGNFLAEQGSATRDRFHIATKAGIDRGEGGKGFNNAPDYLRTCLEQSLRRLQTEYVDLFYVHRRDTDFEIEEVTQTLGQFVKEGKVRSIGFSEIAPNSLRRAAAVHPIAAVQSEYSLQTRQPELGLVQTCAELGTTLVAFSPVGRSLLTDRPIDPKIVPSLPFLGQNPRFQPDALRRNVVKSDGFRALAADMGIPAATLALAWLLHQGDHVVAIPGTRRVAHFKEYLAAPQVRLSPTDIAAIERVLPVGWAHRSIFSRSVAGH